MSFFLTTSSTKKQTKTKHERCTESETVVQRKRHWHWHTARFLLFGEKKRFFFNNFFSIFFSFLRDHCDGACGPERGQRTTERRPMGNVGQKMAVPHPPIIYFYFSIFGAAFFFFVFFVLSLSLSLALLLIMIISFLLCLFSSCYLVSFSTFRFDVVVVVVVVVVLPAKKRKRVVFIVQFNSDSIRFGMETKLATNPV